MAVVKKLQHELTLAYRSSASLRAGNPPRSNETSPSISPSFAPSWESILEGCQSSPEPCSSGDTSPTIQPSIPPSFNDAVSPRSPSTSCWRNRTHALQEQIAELE